MIGKIRLWIGQNSPPTKFAYQLAKFGDGIALDLHSTDFSSIRHAASFPKDSVEEPYGREAGPVKST